MALISKAISNMVMDFSSLFVGLNWPDVREAKADERKAGRVAHAPLRGAKLHKRQRGSEQPWMPSAPSARPLHVQRKRQTDEETWPFENAW